MKSRVTLICSLAILFAAMMLPPHTQRLLLTGPLVWSIDPVNGNDSNPGTTAAPFQTFQHCNDMATQFIDAQGQKVTCQSVPNQTYTNGGFVMNAGIVGLNNPYDFLVDGNGSTFIENDGQPTFSTGNYGFYPNLPTCANSASFMVRGMTLVGIPNSAGQASGGLWANGGVIYVATDGSVTFGAMPGSWQMFSECGGSGVVAMYGSFNVTGGASYLSLAIVQGNVTIQSETVNFVQGTPNGPGLGADGWPAYTAGILSPQLLGTIFVGGGGTGGKAPPLVFNGKAHGAPLNMQPGGLYFGPGVTALPGDAAPVYVPPCIVNAAACP